MVLLHGTRRQEPLVISLRRYWLASRLTTTASNRRVTATGEKGNQGKLITYDDTETQIAPDILVRSFPTWVLQDNREADVHQLAHNHAQGADAPLVGLIVHDDECAAETLLKFVDVRVADMVSHVLDAACSSLELRQGVVHQRAAQTGAASHEVGDSVDDGEAV